MPALPKFFTNAVSTEDGRAPGRALGAKQRGPMASSSSGPAAAGGHERRRHARYVSPHLNLRIEGHKYKTNDWSIGGFRIGGFHRPVRPGDMLVGSIVTWGGLRRESFEADVVRLTPDGQVSCRFLTLPRVVLKIVPRL